MDLFGIATITCTYDPLTAVNAYRNIHHFGMDVLEYKTSIYGEFGGLLNRLDIPRDRFFVSWDLKREAQRPEPDFQSALAPGHRVIETAHIEVLGKTGPLKLDVIQDVRPNLNEELLLVEIPVDFYLMLRETDVEDTKVRRIPLDWRMQTRKVFQGLFEKKYRVIDFCVAKGNPNKNFYVLKK